jgi:urea transport system permease protein
VIRAHAPGLFDASLLIAIPTAFLVAGAIGIAIERGIIRWLYGRPLETLLATWELSLVLQQAVRSIFGPTNKQVGTPSFMQGSVEIFGIGMTLNRVSIVLFALTVFILLLVILHRTALGLQVRAVTQNRRMAGSMGIRTGRVDALTFGLGSGIAGIAGVALTQIDNVSPNLGQGYIIDSFLVVVFGGVGSLWGTLIAAMSIGVANKMLEPYAGAVLGKIILLVVVILFIQKRPRGLFAQKGRAVEA